MSKKTSGTPPNALKEAVETSKHLRQQEMMRVPVANAVSDETFFGGYLGDDGVARCGRRAKNCKCGYRFNKDDRELRACPECSNPRPCGRRVSHVGIACMMHGGNSLSGVASPQFKTGKYTKPPLRHAWMGEDDAAAAFAQSREDGLRLVEDLAMADLLEKKAGERFKFGNVREVVKNMREAYKSYRDYAAAHNEEDVTDMNIAIAGIGCKLVAALAETDNFEFAHDRYMAAQQHHRKLVATEMKRQAKCEINYTVDEMLVIVSQLGHLVRENISNPAELKKIEEGLEIVAGASWEYIKPPT